jgi:hypothetical protein
VTVAPSPTGSGLRRRIGPLPLWGYLVGALGIGGYLWYRNRQAANAAVASTSSGIDPSTGIPYADESNGASTTGDVSSDGAYEGTALDDLETFLAAQEAASGTTSTSTSTTTATATPKTYRPLGSPAAAKSAIKRGDTLYTKGANGAYTPVKPGTKLPKGTPEYIQT